MVFNRGVENIKESIGIGLHQACIDILEKHNGLMLSMNQTQQMENFCDKKYWKNFKTADEFMEENLIEHVAAHSIVVGILSNKRYKIIKNINNDPLKQHKILNIETLYGYLHVYYECLK